LIAGYGIAQIYFYLLFSSNTEYIQNWIIKIFIYILMFPFAIGGVICDLLKINSFSCIPYMQYVFPLTYAIIFPLIYYIYHRIKIRKSS
jgi:hypothetical protein